MTKKRGEKNIFIRIITNQKFLAFLGLIIIIVISFPLAKTVSRRHRINNEIKELEKEIQGIEKKNIDLEKLLGYLESNQFVEEQARLNLGLKREGEEIVIVKDTPKILEDKGQGEVEKGIDSVFNIPGLDKAAPPIIETNPQRWWKYFFNNN